MTEVLNRSDGKLVLRTCALGTCALGNLERFKNMAKDTHLVGDQKKNKDLVNDCTDRNRYEILAS